MGRRGSLQRVVAYTFEHRVPCEVIQGPLSTSCICAIEEISKVLSRTHSVLKNSVRMVRTCCAID